jgi:hypothetical protein
VFVLILWDRTFQIHARISNLNWHMASFHATNDQRNFDSIRCLDKHQRAMQGMPVCFIRSGLKGLSGYIRSFHEVTTQRSDFAGLEQRFSHQCISLCVSCCRHLKTGHICRPRCSGCYFEKLQSISCVQDYYISGATLQIETLAKIQSSDVLDIRPSR